jgi:hypothetical protein
LRETQALAEKKKKVWFVAGKARLRGPSARFLCQFAYHICCPYLRSIFAFHIWYFSQILFWFLKMYLSNMIMEKVFERKSITCRKKEKGLVCGGLILR